MKPPVLIILGETFWDQYEDGSRFLGGAGFNVAWNLTGLGSSSNFVSRVGTDEFGDEFIAEMQKWGISSSYIQRDQQYPTSIMKITLDENKVPTFVNPEHVPFDYLDYLPSFDEFSEDSILYFGTFILRNPKSRSTIQRLKNKNFKVYMDINLRTPHWSHALLDEWIRDLYILKLSDAEAKRLLDDEKLTIDEQKIKLQTLMKERNIQNILFTLGEKGSYWLRTDHELYCKTPRVNVVDTTGAGDAHFAGIIFSKLHGLSDEKSLENASQFAAKICTIKGAISKDKSFYAACLKEIF